MLKTRSLVPSSFPNSFSKSFKIFSMSSLVSLESKNEPKSRSVKFPENSNRLMSSLWPPEPPGTGPGSSRWKSLSNDPKSLKRWKQSLTFGNFTEKLKKINAIWTSQGYPVLMFQKLNCLLSKDPKSLRSRKQLMAFEHFRDFLYSGSCLMWSFWEWAKLIDYINWIITISISTLKVTYLQILI